MKSYLINFINNSDKNENVLSFLNSLCGLDINSNFTIGLLNDFGKIKFYCMIYKQEFENILLNKIKMTYDNVNFKEFDRNYFINKTSKTCYKMDLFKHEPETLLQEYSNNFMNDLLQSLYDKKSINIVEFSIKTNIKKTNILLKGISFFLDCVFYDDKKYIKDNKPIDNKYQFLYNCSINIYSSGSDVILKNISSTFSQLNYNNVFYAKSILREKEKQYNLILSSKELTNLITFPCTSILDKFNGKEIVKNLIDENIPHKGICIAITLEDKLPLCVPTPDQSLSITNYKTLYKKYEHIIDNFCKTKLVMGVPGSGKSEWIVNYCIHCLEYGIPFILVDPKFDSQKRLIESIPDKYLKNVDLLDLGDLLYPPALNIFRRRKENDCTENALITTSFISYMKKQFDRSWGYNLQNIIQMTTDAILLDDVSTMTEFYWMLKEEEYRKLIISIIDEKLKAEHVENKSRLKQLLNYWRNYQSKYEKNPLSVDKEIEPVMNKIGTFIGNRFINAIVSQRESYDFRKTGDTGKSVIINVPEGIINSDNMSLLCGFINKAIWMDYQSRDDMEMIDRYPVQWIIDEAATIIDDEFMGILTKARSRRLGLVLAGQQLCSFDTRTIRMSEAIRDNCKTKLLFKIGYSDARIFADEFDPLTPSDLSDCPDYYFYCRMLLQNGTISNPFLGCPISPAKKLRNYDEYKLHHKSGKLTIGEIENQIDDRLEGIKVMNLLS